MEEQLEKQRGQSVTRKPKRNRGIDQFERFSPAQRVNPHANRPTACFDAAQPSAGVQRKGVRVFSTVLFEK